MTYAKWTSLARQDLKAIGRYIGRKERRPLVAAKILREINSKCNEYAEAFERGSIIGSDGSELGEDCRYFTHKRWVVVFVPILGGIEVLRIFDGSRDFPRLFGV